MNHTSSSSFLWIWEITEVKNIIDYYHSQNYLYSVCNQKCSFCDSGIIVHELNVEVKLSVSINFLKLSFFFSFPHFLSHIMYPQILHIFHRFNFIYFCPSCFLLSCFHLMKLLAETPFCLAASQCRW